jgi:hypothetical protein
MLSQILYYKTIDVGKICLLLKVKIIFNIVDRLGFYKIKTMARIF